MICSSKKCKSGRPGVWEPNILLWADGMGRETHQPITLQLRGFILCDECKKIVRPKQLITSDGWKKICGAAEDMGKLKPSLETADIVFTLPESLEMGGLHV